MKNWKDVRLEHRFFEQGVSCYELTGSGLLNKYYIVSEAETRKLMNSPEVVGYEVYRCLLNPTCQMLFHLKEEGRITSANILSILRGALNYPIEESCFREHIRVHDISFLSSERVFTNGELNGLEIKYNKLTVVPGSSLLIGDIIASGETLVHCLKYVLDYYKNNGASLRNIIFFTIGGAQGVDVLEELTAEIREYWPDFEGFITVYYEGIFNCYEPGDKGVCGFNRALVDFYWKGGVIAPEFRRQTLSKRDPIFEKCTIYDGGARRYEISEHIREVLDFWETLLSRADSIDKNLLLEEKLGHKLDLSYEEWLEDTHYQLLDEAQNRWLFHQEMLTFSAKSTGLQCSALLPARLRQISFLSVFPPSPVWRSLRSFISSGKPFPGNNSSRYALHQLSAITMIIGDSPAFFILSRSASMRS